MIGVPEKRVPKFIRESRKARVALGAGVLLIFVVTFFYQVRKYGESLMHGERKSELDVRITQSLFDSSVIGLQKYRAEHGHYPKEDGKYFFDSIKHYLHVSDIYIYADSTDVSGRIVPIKKRVGKEFYFQNVRRTFLGVGRAEQAIIYQHLAPDSFLLYSVGENEIDEYGAGDDIVHGEKR